MRVTLKIICLMFAAGFLASSAYAGADSRLRPTALGNNRPRMIAMQEEIINKGKKDGGSAVKIFAENVIVSD